MTRMTEEAIATFIKAGLTVISLFLMITFFDSFKGSESKSMLMHTNYKNLHNRTIKT